MGAFLFSKNLIEETIKCFKEEDGLDISSEQANEYLDSLAGLYLAFTDEHPVPPFLKADGALAVDNNSNSSLGISNT